MFTKLFKKNNDDYITKFESKIPKNYEGKIDEGTLRDLFVRYILLWNDKGIRIIQGFKIIFFAMIIMISIPFLVDNTFTTMQTFITMPIAIKIFFSVNTFLIFLAGLYPFISRYYWNDHDIERHNSQKLIMFWLIMSFWDVIGLALIVTLLGNEKIMVGFLLIAYSIFIYFIEILVYLFISVIKSFSDKTVSDLEAVLYKLQIFTDDMRPSQKISILNHLINYYKDDLKIQKRPLFLSQTQNSIAEESLKLLIPIVGAIYTTMLAFSKVYKLNFSDLLGYGVLYGIIIIIFSIAVYDTYKTEFVETKRLLNESNNGLMLRSLFELKKLINKKQ